MSFKNRRLHKRGRFEDYDHCNSRQRDNIFSIMLRHRFRRIARGQYYYYKRSRRLKCFMLIMKVERYITRSKIYDNFTFTIYSGISSLGWYIILRVCVVLFLNSKSLWVKYILLYIGDLNPCNSSLTHFWDKLFCKISKKRLERRQMQPFRSKFWFILIMYMYVYKHTPTPRPPSVVATIHLSNYHHHRHCEVCSCFAHTSILTTTEYLLQTNVDWI